ncbi:hypothetical protein BD310DRAFT_246679 [Dichomitus squalens]|uniref:Uncharacterized protein n=1 Tax=Dichomitus squalens TaxID=114155 RepID=A0A4Q9PBX0_9APHY|nr:hypothetical protein BD310DRAFT_246679 [Dichomitus squalens]
MNCTLTTDHVEQCARFGRTEAFPEISVSDPAPWLTRERAQGDEAVRTTTLYARAAAADLRMIWRTQTALDSEVAPNPSALPRDRLVHVSRAREPALRFSL